MTNGASLSGLIPILSTPFESNGEIDLPSLRRLLQFHLDSGADGVAIFGMASEGFTLTAGDRRSILECSKQVVNGQIPIVAGVCATSLATAVEQASELVAGGADALMVLPPVLVGSTPDQLREYYGVLAERLPVEIMVQDAQGVTGQSMSIELISELSRIDGVGSVKVEAQPTAPKVGAVCQSTDSEFGVFGGANALFLLEELAQGAVGTMPACEFTDLLRDVLDAWSSGDSGTAHELFNSLLPLIRFGMQPGLAWAVHKEVLAMRGIIDDPAVRMPARPLDVRSRAQLAGIVDRLEFAPVGTS